VRRWIGYHHAPNAEIDQEELVREHPQDEPNREVEDRAERMHERWLDRIGGTA
jgi:hypothetical protein